MISFFIWDVSRELFSINFLTLRWNALMLILAFIISLQLLRYIYKRENKPINDVGIIITYLILATLVGARLGYVIFYDPELILTKPAEIFFPFEFQPGFRFTDTKGLSIHGALVGILIGLWIYTRKNKPGQNYLQVLDRISIIALITGAFLFAGSFLNSEIIGKPTDSSVGTIFIKPVTKGISNLPCCIMRNPDGKNPLNLVTTIKDNSPLEHHSTGYQSIILYLFFSPGATEQLVNEFLIGDVKTFLFDMSDIVHESGAEPLHYTIFVEKNGNYAARIRTTGIARYPVQLFEAAACIIFFYCMMWYWNKKNALIPPGKIFGLSMIFFWSLHFAFGFLKETEAQTMIAGLAMDQILSILFTIAGVVVLMLSSRKTLLPLLIIPLLAVLMGKDAGFFG